MLSRLHITNYALIDDVDVAFGPGMNVITGETGAGKSIMLGALSLILGARADSRAVSHKDAKSVIEATFKAADVDSARRFCEANDIDWDDSECILRRELTPTGRSRTFINDTPVTVGQLRELAMMLVDIHSQHQNLLLADPAFQLSVIDNMAGNAARLDEYSRRYKVLRDAMRKLRSLRENLRKGRDDEEFTRYQYEQLDALKLVKGEQAELEQRRDVLVHAQEISSALDGALSDLDTDDDSVTSRVSAAIRYLSMVADRLPDGDDLVGRLESVKIEVEDIVETLGDVAASLDADPRELGEIEERLSAIYSMQSRHHVDTVEELIALRETLGQRLDSIQNGDEEVVAAEKEARRAMALVKEAAAALSRSRKEAADRLAADLREAAAPLGMKNLQCEIRVSPADISHTGADNVEFLFAFNKNQPLMPVAKTASGGEISRLMLSLKSLIASHMQLPSIIFDEIDTGVSGDVACRMGEMMSGISSNIQVITITHLPQVAAKGVSHYKVYKEDDATATHTHIVRLDEEARVGELSLMLSGSATDEKSRQAAISLLNNRS